MGRVEISPKLTLENYPISNSNIYDLLQDKQDDQLLASNGCWGISASEQVAVDAPVNDDLANHTINSTNNIDFIQPKSSYETDDFIEFAFSSKGLNISNLNIRHVIPKIDEISVLMASDNSPDILGLCETFLQKNNHDSQISINGFNVLRKDR